MTERFIFGLIGERIGYSRSPSVFNAIFAADGVSGSFQLFDIAIDEFDAEFRRVVQSGVRGLAVTIPHKERVLPYLHELDGASRALLTVNSISIGDRLRGFNTDVIGFGLPLAANRDELAGESALVLGAGGAARAAMYALARDFGCRRFVIAARNAKSAELARQHVTRAADGVEAVIVTSAELAEADPGRWAIVVNATPLGGPNYPGESPVPQKFDWRGVGLYYDLNYNFDNRVVARAVAEGVPALDGSAMLVGQALESYRLWTGRSVAFEAVYPEAFPDRRPPEASRDK